MISDTPVTLHQSMMLNPPAIEIPGDTIGTRAISVLQSHQASRGQLNPLGEIGESGGTRPSDFGSQASSQHFELAWSEEPVIASNAMEQEVPSVVRPGASAAALQRIQLLARRYAEKEGLPLRIEQQARLEIARQRLRELLLVPSAEEIEALAEFAASVTAVSESTDAIVRKWGL